MLNGEKRNFKRVDLNTPVRYQIRGTPDYGNTLTDNISEAGLAMNIDSFIPPSTPVMMEVNILNRVLHPLGIARWCQPIPHSSGNRMGIEFVEFDPLERKYLRDFINMKSV